MRKFLIFALLAGASNFASAGTVYYFDLVNTAASTVTAFDIALPRSERFNSILPGNAPLPGGGESVTVALRKGDDGCLRDLRIGFADGHVLMYRDFNICRGVRFYTGVNLRREILATKAAESRRSP